MKVVVTVKPNAKRDSVEANGGVYVVHVKATPTEGKANEAVRKLLANYFGVTQSQMKLIHGRTARRKTFEIDS